MKNAVDCMCYGTNYLNSFFWKLKKFGLIITIIIIIIIPTVRLDIQLLFEITKNMHVDVIEILFVISDEELVNIEDNGAESSASDFGPQDISSPGPSRRPTQQENLEQLREMFPKKNSSDLMQAIRKTFVQQLFLSPVLYLRLMKMMLVVMTTACCNSLFLLQKAR